VVLSPTNDLADLERILLIYYAILRMLWVPSPTVIDGLSFLSLEKDLFRLCTIECENFMLEISSWVQLYLKFLFRYLFYDN